jgi:hypothetical protein
MSYFLLHQPGLFSSIILSYFNCPPLLAFPKRPALIEIRLTNRNRSTGSLLLGIKNTNPTSSSSAITRLYTAGMQGFSSAPASMRMTMNWHIWRRYTSSWRSLIASLGTCASWIWFLTFTRCVVSLWGKTE